jgi:predicted Rossmann fold nucleotide-binding protein DprA/Smf involved in DNA uptake
MITDIEDLYREISDLKCKYLNLSKKFDSTKTIQLKPDKPSNHQIPSGTDINKLCDEIVKKLDNIPIEINEIISELNVSSNIINAALIQLELLDKVEINQGRVSVRID